MAEDSTRMPKVNFEKDLTKIHQSQLNYMKLLEQENLKRVQAMRKLKGRNGLTGILLGGSVLGIFAYTMMAIKQESFLDDFDDPNEKKE